MLQQTAEVVGWTCQAVHSRWSSVSWVHLFAYKFSDVTWGKLLCLSGASFFFSIGRMGPITVSTS